MRKTILIVTFSALLGALVAAPLAVYAADLFEDVADSNVFHDDIAWLQQSGITQGCNPPTNTQFLSG
jgi:hypothetical protein